MKHHPVVPRERILETALRLFHQQGYHATGINQIIGEAGVAKASLYQNFSSKEDIGVEFLKAREESWFSLLRQFTDEPKKSKKKVLAAFDFIHYMNETENFNGCTFLNMLPEIRPENHALLTVIQEHKTNLRDFFKQLMPDSKPHLSDSVYLLFESALQQSALFKDQWPVEQARETIEALFKSKYLK